MKTPALGPAERGEALARMADRELDVLVVGGGVVGAGTALDAATRGLETALVESRDWACGTSSRSSKLVHGGLRYLEMLDFALVREALKERGLLLERIAPHLVKPVPFLYPLQHRAWERLYAGSGVALYDAMSISSGHGRGLPAHRHLSRRRALQVAPCLKKDALVGALQYYDAQMDDARYVATLVRTAAKYGAQVANRARVVGFLREGERVVGARVHDLEQGGEFEVRARQVVNATGVWTDETQALIGERGQFHVRASKGIHLVVPKDRIHSTTGLILRTEKSVLFVIPWGRHWIVGTTDTDWDLDKAHPAASSADIDYLLEHVNEVLAVPLTRDDVEGVYAGLRPLLAGESDATSKLSREHTVAHPVPGLVVVAGGKYTTYRVMAKDAVDEAVHGLDRRVGPCVTEEIPLVGAVGYKALWNARERIGSTGRAACGADRASAQPLRLGDAGGAGPDRGRPVAGEAARRGRGLSARRDRLRRLARGGPPSGRRPHPPHPHLDRDLRPRYALRPRGGRADGARAGLGPGPDRPGGRALREAGGGRARVPASAGRSDGGRGEAGRAGHHPAVGGA